MTTDLKTFHGKSAEQVTKTLLATGYKEVLSPTSLCRVFRDAEATHLIRLSQTPSLTAAFCSASTAHYHTNPEMAAFLPRIFNHVTISPALHISMTENLLRLDETAHKADHTLFGHARAVSSFFAGDDMHKDVHRCMIHEPALLQAAQMIITLALREGRKIALRPDAAKIIPAINPCGDSIWFRCNDAGCQTVYADPFMESSQSAKNALQELQWMNRRFSKAEISAASSPYWRDIQP